MLYTQEKTQLKLNIRQQGGDLICYLPEDKQILFPYGDLSCRVGRSLGSVFETCMIVSRFAKADRDPDEIFLSQALKEQEQPCLALAHLLSSLLKISGGLWVYKDHIVFYGVRPGKVKAKIREAIGEYFSQRDNNGYAIHNLYKVVDA